MPRDKGAWRSESFAATSAAVRSTGRSVTHEATQVAKKTNTLNKLVDPRTHEVSRESNNFFVEQPDSPHLVLRDGVALPVKLSLDTTGSMGDNVDRAFSVVGDLLGLIVQHDIAVAKRYNVQFATAVMQDIKDDFPHEHSEFEPDNEFERQMSLLVPERVGGDSPEDYQLDLWYSAERIKCRINDYGLKGYYFAAADEEGRDYLYRGDVLKVYGIDIQSEIKVADLGKMLLKKWHGFFLQIGNNDRAARWWGKVLGPDRVVKLPRTEHLAYVQASLIGLTEGTLSLQGLPEFLAQASKLVVEQADKNDPSTEAKTLNDRLIDEICFAVANVPTGLQSKAENFSKIPPKGSVFASKEDLWPIEGAQASTVASEPDDIGWL